MAQAENSLHTSRSSRSSFMLHSHLYNDSRSGKNRGGNNMNTCRYVHIGTLCLTMWSIPDIKHKKTYNFFLENYVVIAAPMCSQNCPQLS